MNLEAYKKIKEKLYIKYPAGLGYRDMADPEDLWNLLSDTPAPKDFTAAFILHRINIEATKKHIITYKRLLEKLHKKAHVISKMYKTPSITHMNERVTIRINSLYSLINMAENNIKTSEYGLLEQIKK